LRWDWDHDQGRRKSIAILSCCVLTAWCRSTIGLGILDLLPHLASKTCSGLGNTGLVNKGKENSRPSVKDEGLASQWRCSVYLKRGNSSSRALIVFTHSLEMIFWNINLSASNKKQRETMVPFLYQLHFWSNMKGGCDLFT
jgi:hypothetical protein